MKKECREQILRSASVDGILLTGAANMRYVTGFTGEGYVYLSERRTMVVTDARYTVAAAAECQGCEIVCRTSGAGYYDALAEAVRQDGIRSLGFEDEEMTVAEYDRMRKAMQLAIAADTATKTGVQEAGQEMLRIEPLNNYVTGYRAVKTSEEIAWLEEAEAIGDRAFARLLPELEPGMTEKQVAARIEFLMREEGAEGTAFDTIAASGIHSAMPHAVPTDKRLAEGDFLTMDFGCHYHGYCSDMTRTVVVGKASTRQREIYDTVLRAQQVVLAQMRPGMTGREVDALARNQIRQAGYGSCFGHSLGHSVGLEIHEKPLFSEKEETVIRPGMVITVEPGIYIEEFGGVRIEDVAVVTEDGCRSITRSPKDLIEIRNGGR